MTTITKKPSTILSFINANNQNDLFTINNPKKSMIPNLGNKVNLDFFDVDNDKDTDLHDLKVVDIVNSYIITTENKKSRLLHTIFVYVK